MVPVVPFLESKKEIPVNRSWKITSIVTGIVVASSAGLLTIETQICDALEPGPFALV